MSLSSFQRYRSLLAKSLPAAALLVGALPSWAQSGAGDASAEIAALKRALAAQQAVTRQLARRIDTLSAAQARQQQATHQQLQLAVDQAVAASRHDAATTVAVAPPPAPPAVEAGYKGGFYIRDGSGDNTLNINGLLQPRYRFFQPGGTTKFGAKDEASSNFDIFLARLYFSGNIVDPSLTYWITLQGTTQSNPGAPDITLLDAEIAKTFSPYLKVEMGRYWSSYTYEYYLDIGQYLFPDLSAAEWAFSLGRQLGARASGKVDNFAYSLSVSNPIPGSLSGATENPTTKLAVIGNVYWDILAPYGYKETDPNSNGAPTPELSLWASAMYNPVQNGSRVYNDVTGDNTIGGTASLNFRYGLFTFQASGYYKHTDARGVNEDGAAHPAFDSYGWQEQAGYYLIPQRLEIAERIDGVHWGYRQTGPVVADAASDTQWYSGPDNFGYRNITEYTADLNYYLHGHNAKAQLAYSYLAGSTFNGASFDANRFILQTQLAF